MQVWIGATQAPCLGDCLIVASVNSRIGFYQLGQSIYIGAGQLGELSVLKHHIDNLMLAA